MKEDSARAMEEALQAAVARMHAGSARPAGDGPPDAIGLMMTVVSKLMQSNESREDLIERLDGIQKEDLAIVRSQLKVLRKQVQLLVEANSQLLQTQQGMLAELRELCQQQATVGNAVVDLADQMARVEILEELPRTRGRGPDDGALNELHELDELDDHDRGLGGTGARARVPPAARRAAAGEHARTRARPAKP